MLHSKPSSKRLIQFWYATGAVLVFVMLIVGGITRLTGSGLSIVEWKPIVGILPPISESAWLAEFENYQEFPQYKQVNLGMSLHEFKEIYFWEYLHRLLGRIIGFVFIIPFLSFWCAKYFDATEFRRSLVLLSLGMTQGLLGWLMVKSGLIDVPYVSPYRLTLHLTLAFLIFACCVWFALSCRGKFPQFDSVNKLKSRPLKNLLIIFLFVLGLQVVWGALVAGHKAGKFYNTFPRMHQHWIPPELLIQEPILLNFFTNPVTVQWIHRILATVLLLLAMLIFFFVMKLKIKARIRNISLLLLSIVICQYALGILTLLWRVPLFLGVLHQAMAMLMLTLALYFLFNLRTKE